ncbi:MAG: xanthine dehydrogenase family protein molybdopterin-binding subunit, partial [Nitrososphaerota archaeon]
MKYVGKPIQRIDAYEKVTGFAEYAGDLELPGMLYAKLLLSPYAHARIRSIDISNALKIQGVVTIATGEDFPFRVGLYV